MDRTLLNAYKALNDAQSAIRRAQSLDEALREGFKSILTDCGVESGAVWFSDTTDGDRLHPYFWVGASDLTSRVHQRGEGSVGRVFDTQTTERFLDFTEADDPLAVEDFAHTRVKSMICVPFSGGDAISGCMQFVNKTDGATFTDSEADICEMVAMLEGMAIEQSERFQPAPKHGATIMRVRGITRAYQNGDEVTQVLKGVNLDVFEGELLVLLGESGCGKTTLLNIIGGLDRPNSGSLELFGEEYAGASQRRLTQYRRHNIGFIFQSYNLMPNLNARQNLQLMASLVPNPLPAEEALQVVGLGSRMRNYPSQLSGGQQQRVSIARALVKRPRVILADEPTAALDYATSIEVLDVMERVIAQGTTVVMVTHNEEICRMADRVVRLRGGRVYEVSINRHKAHATELVW